MSSEIAFGREMEAMFVDTALLFGFWEVVLPFKIPMLFVGAGSVAANFAALWIYHLIFFAFPFSQAALELGAQLFWPIRFSRWGHSSNSRYTTSFGLRIISFLLS
jgi:hypothetical protein